MTTPDEKESLRSRVSTPGLLLLSGLVVAATVVFGLLPRWVAEPLVTTDVRPQATPKAPASFAAPTRTETAAPSAPVAREGVAPAPSTPADDPWAASVSDGLGALERGAFEEARAAFARAEAARPGTSAVADGLARAEAGARMASVAELRRRAEAAEAQESWRAALGEYDAALRLEPAAAFAVEGRARTALRAQIDERFVDYLGHPERLSAEAVAREVEAALDATSEVQPRGPRLTRQVAALQQLLSGARTPVAVHLLSDGRTDVSVLRVGRLGPFKEKALDLRPGSYVVVGTRPGYRDARLTLIVPPGRSPDPLVVRCEEAL